VRVIQVTDYGSPFAGSFVPMLRVGLQAMETRGWKAEAVLPPRARGRDWLEQLRDVSVLFAPEGGLQDRARWLRSLVDAEPGPTVLHSHFTEYDLPVAAAARSRPAVTAYWHLHTVLSPRPSIRVRNRIKFSLLSRPVERILCVAPHLAQSVIARGGPPEKVTYFPNGLDVDAYPLPSQERRRVAREQLGLPQDAAVLLHFGRNWGLKGGDLFLEAVKRLRDGGHADVVAVSSRGGAPAMAEAEALGLADVVHVPEDVEHVQELFAAADLFMATSRAEGMPLSVLESLASGVPVVASDIPGHALPGLPRGPLLAVPLDAEALAAAAAEQLERSREDPALDTEVARDWIREQMGVVDWADRMIDLYEQTARGAM
jgi:glycosyltransferase involved in cell wall biosynthesis